MGGSCCEGRCDALTALRAKQSRVLRIVLGINAVMYLVELVTGLVTGSSSVLTDGLAMLGDAVVYASSLYVLGRGRVCEARMAVLKGAIMVPFGGGVLLDVVLRHWAIGFPPPTAWASWALSRSAPISIACSSSRGIDRTTSTCGRSGSARATISSPTSACSWPLAPFDGREHAGRTCSSVRSSRASSSAPPSESSAMRRVSSRPAPVLGWSARR